MVQTADKRLLTEANGAAKFPPKGAFTKTTTEAGTLDWLNNAASGYLAHFRTGSATTSVAAAVGIGTDRGAGNGLLVSHKNSGKGVSIAQAPGAGDAISIGARSALGAPLRVLSEAGSAPVLLQVSSGQSFVDGVTTAGSTNLDSATAAFVAGDVGKTLAQLTSRDSADPAGCIPAGATIVSVTSATRVVMSAAAGATGTAVLFNLSGRTPASTQNLFETRDVDGSLLVEMRKSGTFFAGKDTAQKVVQINAPAGQTVPIFDVLLNGAQVVAVTNTGALQTNNGVFYTNGQATGSPVMSAATLSNNPSIQARRGASATGDLFAACANGYTALSRFDKDGFLMTKLQAAPADASITAGEIAFWFDSTNGAAKLMFKGKEAGGTVRTGSVALA